MEDGGGFDSEVFLALRLCRSVVRKGCAFPWSFYISAGVAGGIL
jgi:hypothetical protein